MLIEPRSEAEVVEAVREARARRAPLAIEGGGTKRGLGRPVQAERTLSLRGLSGITLYEPAEMVIGAWAGTPLAEVQRTLDARGQMLAFEPPDWRALLGATGEQTIGGLVACGLAGPRRVMAGGLRDSLIGVRFVNGRAEAIKNGGRVMKNVTGLDLVKLQAGAHGTLGVLTEAIFKVVPKPPAELTLRIVGLSEAEGVAALCRAMGSPYEPTGAAYRPDESAAYLRLEGFEDQLAYRSAALRTHLGLTLDPLPDEAGRQVWSALRNVAALGAAPTDAVWRVSVAPTKAVSVIAAIAAVRPVRRCLDWSGGLVWLATPEEDRAGAALIQRIAAEAGGHATLIRAPEALRATADVFQPLPPAVMTLQAGLKASFDPDRILNPGRMHAGL
jgi:glycolate oxidase FAD binding subunit